MGSFARNVVDQIRIHVSLKVTAVAVIDRLLTNVVLRMFSIFDAQVHHFPSRVACRSHATEEKEGDLLSLSANGVIRNEKTMFESGRELQTA